jgi:hypothetical protein
MFGGKDSTVNLTTIQAAPIQEGYHRRRPALSQRMLISRSERSEWSQMEAAELLGISERTFRRRRDWCTGLVYRIWMIGGWRRHGAGHRLCRSSAWWAVSRSLQRFHDAAYPGPVAQAAQLSLGYREPSCICIARAWLRGPISARRTARSAHAGRWSA